MARVQGKAHHLRAAGGGGGVTINAPRPWQLTVGKLREALKDAHDNSVVALSLQGGFTAPSIMKNCIYNLEVGRTDCPLIKLTIFYHKDRDDDH